MPPAFPRGAMIRLVNEEPAIMFGSGRALLLQLAHPHVAAGVDTHSDFQHNPFKRLQGTLEAVYTMVFGSAELADRVGRRIQWIHTFVTGPDYEANDPANLLWVHATLLDSALTCYQRLVRPLTADELEAYYQEMTVVAERFGCPRSAQPATYPAFVRWWDEQVAAIEVTDTARRLSADILRPVLPLGLHVPLAPVIAVFRLVTVGTMPASLQRQFGFSWSDAEQRRLDAVHRLARAVFRLLPHDLRAAPGHLNGKVLLYQAERHARQFEAKLAARQGVATGSAA